MNQKMKTSSELTKCPFCCEPVRLGCSWWDDKPGVSLRKHVLSPCMEEVLTDDGIKMAYVTHKCNNERGTPRDGA